MRIRGHHITCRSAIYTGTRYAREWRRDTERCDRCREDERDGRGRLWSEELQAWLDDE